MVIEGSFVPNQNASVSDEYQASFPWLEIYLGGLIDTMNPVDIGIPKKLDPDVPE